MQSLADSELLRLYSERGSEEAFAALTERHVNLVYSVAFRESGNAHHAQEITQAVFIILARKAAQLRRDKALSGWLFQTTRLTAKNFVRGEMRRQRRDQEAFMESTLNQTANEAWPQMAHLLDPAVESLREKDRRAIVLRFYEGRNLREVGIAMGASEAAAEKRVNRALEKLRRIFHKRSTALSLAAIAGAAAGNSVHAAPAGLAKTAATIAVGKGAAASASTLTIVKGALKIMAWTKAKTAAVTAAAALLFVGTGVLVVDGVTHTSRQARQILERSLAKYAAMQSYSSSGTTLQEDSDNHDPVVRGSFQLRLGRPDLYRLEYEFMSPHFTNRASLWSDGSGHYFENLVQKELGGVGPDGKPISSGFKLPFTGMRALQENLGNVDDVSGGAIAFIPSMFFGVEIPAANNHPWNIWLLSTHGLRNWHPVRVPDETVDGVDCYVLSITLVDSARSKKAWLWIGKQDHLVHQSRERIDFSPDPSDQEVSDLMDEMKKAGGKVTLSAAEIRRRLTDGTKKATATGHPVTVSFDLPKGQPGMQSITLSPLGFRLRTQTLTNIAVGEKFTGADFTPSQS